MKKANILFHFIIAVVIVCSVFSFSFNSFLIFASPVKSDEENPQAQIIKSVQANKDYLVIVSSYDPHTMFGTYSLNTSN